MHESERVCVQVCLSVWVCSGNAITEASQPASGQMTHYGLQAVWFNLGDFPSHLTPLANSHSLTHWLVHPLCHNTTSP